MRIAIRRMLQANQPGVILHISSIGAQKSSITTPLYQCSKHGISHFVRAMAPLDVMVGIRVIGVAPGVTRSPLFTDHPRAMAFVDESKDFMVTPEEIAKGMFAVATDLKYPPGTILEVKDAESSGGWREVFLLNDPGPQGKGTVSSNRDHELKNIMAILESEKKSGTAKL